MLFLLRPSLFLAGLAFAGVLFGAHTVIRTADARFDAARAHADTGCRAYRSAPRNVDADICRNDAFQSSSMKAFKEGKTTLAASKAAFNRGDASLGRIELAHTLDIADGLDKKGTIIGALMAAATVKDALDVLDAHVTSPDQRLQLLAHVRLATAEAPLESERVHRQWMLANSNLPGGVLGRAVITDQMREDDVELAEMNRALLAGDVARCEAAVQGHGMEPSGLDRILCKKMSEVMKTSERLDREVNRALLASTRPRI